MTSNSDAFEETADAGNPATRVALAPGRSLGKYRLDRILGEGGMGVVWAAHDPDLERAVAIKVLRYAQASPQLRQRLLREARAMAKLKHPNVLTVYEVGTVDDRDYIAMELVEGTSLDRWLAASPPQEEVWSAIIASGRGLAAAHDAGVVHRDFKPHNVLRSREGRVLVTDFGLARGLLGEEDSAAIASPGSAGARSNANALRSKIDARPVDPIDPAITPFDRTLEASSSNPRASDSVLDSPLTQTGALIGTPAYMAPEQYHGAPPDPRTDQFAFCVTMWQALTGDRPFKGQSLDEMRKSVSAGVSHIQAKLPGAVRAVLERGLDPHPEERWPSLEVLLDALERAGRAPARRRRIALAIATLGAIGLVIGALAIDRSQAKAKDGCDNSELVFAEAWSPVVRGELARTPGVQPQAFVRVADALDQFRERWMASYDKTCRARSSPGFRARIACLEGMRDQVSAFAYLLRDPRVYHGFDPWAVLPNIAVCESASPNTPAVLPTEQPRRSQVLQAVARSFALNGVPPAELDVAVNTLIADVKAIKWQPLMPIVLVAAGAAYLRHQSYTRAREVYKQALASFPKDGRRDAGLEATARLGLLEAAQHELEKPSARVPPGITDPSARPVLHDEIARLLASVTSSVGSNPMMLGARASLAALAYAELGQYNRYKHAYDEALDYVNEARKHFEAMGDIRRAAGNSRLEALIYLTRGDDRALDDALFATRRAADALEAAKLPPLPALDEILAMIAFARSNYNEAHRLYDRLAPHRTIDAPTIKGRIVTATANAIASPGSAGARSNANALRSEIVVAWRGELVGDPRRLYVQPGFVGDIATVEHDGTFTIRAERGWAIMVEGNGVRSTPQIVGDKPLAVKLEPVSTVSGTVKGPNNFGIRAYARYRAGASQWSLQVPVDRDGFFDLRGLPPGDRSFGLTGQAGTGHRITATGPKYLDIAWPHGQAIEVIVRAPKFDAGAQAWVLHSKRSEFASRADFEAVVATAFDVATSELGPIGVDNTDAGREVYRAGDRHAVITGNVDDDYTVCVSATASGPVTCKVLAVKRTVEVSYPDGRFAAGVTPIVFEL